MDRVKKIKNCFDAGNELRIENKEYQKFLINFFDYYLAMDLESGDSSQFPVYIYEKSAKAVVKAKSPGIIAGLDEIVFLLISRNMKVSSDFCNGQFISDGEILMTITGSAAGILSVERTVLNILQRLCGIATKTKEYVDLISRPDCFMIATRKTLWGLLDKCAVQLGGGLSHRLSLADAAMLKENHLAILKNNFKSNGVEMGLRKIIKKSPNLRFIEIEVTSEEEFWEMTDALSIDTNIPKVIMFDHFAPVKIASLIEQLKNKHLYGRVLLEASGNVTKNTVAEYARSGVDVISSGALTHSAPSMDLSLTF